MKNRVRILFLAANPEDKTQLKLGREFDLVRESLRRGRFRNAFQLLSPVLAARASDLGSALIEYRPHVVHFCGHGSEDLGIVFETEGGYSRPADARELTELFREVRRDVRLVFLNACHTAEQAQALASMFDYIVGTSGLILDSVAGEYAGWFYRALAHGATVGGAVSAAHTAVDGRAAGIAELTKGEGADDSRPFILQVLNCVPAPSHVRLPQEPARNNPPPAKGEHPQPGAIQVTTSVKDSTFNDAYTSGRDMYVNLGKAGRGKKR
ncbi:MAG TPA: CHAT domain-containing protein [Pyrinomonadaceae bacterium]|nr:CHAT domain-containing protein [Pyrinomonadaceae bacterium]